MDVCHDPAHIALRRAGMWKVCGGCVMVGWQVFIGLVGVCGLIVAGGFGHIDGFPLWMLCPVGWLRHMTVF